MDCHALQRGGADGHFRVLSGSGIAENSDPVAMTGQADMDKFYRRVIEPARVELFPGPDPITGIAPDLDTF